MKNLNPFRTKLRPTVLIGSLIGIVLFLSPRAHAEGAPTPMDESNIYDSFIVGRAPGYSRTTGPDGAGGYVENTYYTYPNGVRKTVQVRKYNKGDVKHPSYRWYTFPGSNGGTINVTTLDHHGKMTFTKEEIDSGGAYGTCICITEKSHGDPER